MPRFTVPTLENEIAQRLVTAAAAAATTYVRPARFPKWVRRGITASSTLTNVGMALAGDRRPAASQLTTSDPKNTVDVVNGQAQPRTGANWAAATSAGMALVTSGMAMRIDRSVEKALIKRGVRHPRLWMAVGAATVSLVGPWVAAQAKEIAAKYEKNLPSQVLQGRLADPLGTNATSKPSAPQLTSTTDSRSVNPGNGDASVGPRQDESKRTEADEQA